MHFVELHIQNMTNNCCMYIARQELEKLNYSVVKLKPAFVKLHSPNEIDEKAIQNALAKFDMRIMRNPEKIVVEHIKRAVTELIQDMNNISSIADKSEYLVEKLRMSYRQISAIFTKYEPVTLERFIILHKIERIKSLIDTEEFTLSEISYMMDYSSVQYLSTQFKKEVGVSVTEYKEQPELYRKSLDNLY